MFVKLTWNDFAQLGRENARMRIVSARDNDSTKHVRILYAYVVCLLTSGKREKKKKKKMLIYAYLYLVALILKIRNISEISEIFCIFWT